MNKDKEITHEMMLEVNGDNYDPSDIRTYTCKPLSGSPSREVAIHLSLYNSHKSGKRNFSGSWAKTPYGGHFCDGSSEFNEKVTKMALNFPKASEFNQVKLIKTVKLPSLYPSWMMERYQKHEGVVLHHNTPIFYDAKADKFVLFLDTEFFRDTTPTGLSFSTGDHTYIYEGKRGKRYAAFRADSMKELLNCMDLQYDDTPLNKYIQVYKQRFLGAANAERVICLAMKVESSNIQDLDHGVSGNSIMLNSSTASRSNRNLIQELVISQKTEFELYQGALIDDLIYLMDEDGNIKADAIICSVKHQRQRKEAIQMHHHDDFTYLMMPYTKSDWDSLKMIHERMLNLMSELSNFFSTGYNQNELMDMSVNDIATDTPKLLR